MYFQASDFRGRNFLELNDSDNKAINPTYAKGGAWLKHIGRSNTVYAHITRLIINHATIGEYRQRFLPSKPVICPCRHAPLKTHNHILFECKRYRQSWNPKQDSLKDILTFLEFNPGIFCFQEGIT